MTEALEVVDLPWLQEPKFRCFGCSPRNPVGLALQMQRLPGHEILARITFSEDYASYPGVVHGGIVTVLVDEVMGNLIALDRGLLAFSVTLRTKNLLPIRTGVRYLTIARISGEGNGILRTEADVLDADGESHVMASGSYQPMRSEHARDVMGLTEHEHGRLHHYFDHEIGPA